MRRKIKILKSNMRVRRNSSVSAKIEFRKALMSKIGIEDPWILDCFCGSGVMHKEAYSSTNNYLGLDLKYYSDDRRTIVCDNKRMLRQIDLEGYDIFDLDAYGTPMPAFTIICDRFRWTLKDKIAFVMTDGSGLNAKYNNLSQELFNYIQISRHLKTRFQHEEMDTILFMSILKGVETLKGKIRDLEVIGKDHRSFSGVPLRYISFIVEKLND